MTPREPVRHIRLTAAAEADIADIVEWTAETLGPTQARVYARTLTAAITALSGGPRVAGAKPRNDVAQGVFVLHVARGRRKGRHFIVFRPTRDPSGSFVNVLRVLHDAMDLARHVEPSEEDR